MKKVFFIAILVVIAVVVVLCVNKFKSDELVCNDLLVENVEALTQGDIPEGPPLTNWKTYNYQCPLKIVTETYFIGVTVVSQIPKGYTPVMVGGQLGYYKTKTTNTTPLVEKCGSGLGSCFFSQDC